MEKRCIFCGKVPETKTKEHVIPQWLINMTGDPKRNLHLGSPGLPSFWDKIVLGRSIGIPCL